MNLDVDFSIMREPGFFNRIFEERRTDVAEINKTGWVKIDCCPICKTKNEKNSVYYKPEYGDYYRCSYCSCLYSHKVPVSLNAGQYSMQTVDTIQSIPDEQKREYRKQRFGEERIRIIDRFLEKPLSKSSVLDIGCNTGFFLEVAKGYFNRICGLEKSDTLAIYANKKTGCQIFTDVSIVDRKFDVITMFDTLEHLPDPLGFLKKCLPLLSDNGLLFVITPNYKSFGFDVLEEKCNQISPGHLALFCEDTCDYVYSQLPLEPVLYQTQGMDVFDIFAYLRDILNFNYHEFGNEKMNGLQDKLNRLGYGNSLRFVLKKR